MPDKEVPVKDYLEEHRRLKEERNSPQLAQPLKPAASLTTPQPPPSAPQHAAQPVRAAEPQSQQLSLVQLIEQLKSLGYDVQPLESLKGFADKLDAEEKRLMKEINERQERLRVVKEARRLLRVLGV